MEQLIFVLFILFSLFSVLMERRKRKRQAAQQAAPEQARQGDMETEEVGEESWSFPTDPFELEPQKPQRLQEEEATAAAQQEALDAEERAQVMEHQVQDLERQARRGQPRRSAAELVREKLAREQQRAQTEKKKNKRWKLNPERARQAIVYAEILGRPKAERDEEV